MSVKQASLAVMLAGMWALGCSGSPTSSSGFQLILTVSVANTAMAATITQADLIVDGAAASLSVPPAPEAVATLNTTGQAGSGSHTMQIQIAGQTSSPNSYTVAAPTIQVFDQGGSLRKTIQLPAQTAVLATGGSISYTFSL
jgi:hypothetical protein